MNWECICWLYLWSRTSVGWKNIFVFWAALPLLLCLRSFRRMSATPTAWSLLKAMFVWEWTSRTVLFHRCGARIKSSWANLSGVHGALKLSGVHGALKPSVLASLKVHLCSSALLKKVLETMKSFAIQKSIISWRFSSCSSGSLVTKPWPQPNTCGPMTVSSISCARPCKRAFASPTIKIGMRQERAWLIWVSRPQCVSFSPDGLALCGA